MKLLKGISGLAILALCSGCIATSYEDSSDGKLVFETENFMASSGNIQKTNAGVTASGDGWVTFELEVDSVGRYKTEFFAKGNGSVWVEDYHDNPDGRTYNITGAVNVNANAFTLAGKDGSPLNVGKHNMKLHFSGEVEVDRVQFTKMIDHEYTPTSMAQNTSGSEWRLVWSDEFEGEGAPDATKWTYDVGNWGWGNNEPQYYTKDRRENARLEDGNLIIEAHKNDMGQEWTSARLTTRGKVSFLYGKIEFRAKSPSLDGTWAAGWLLGDDYRDELSWPYCGEIDVLENIGSEIDDETGNGINHASCHTRTYYFKEGTHITAVKEVEDMTNTFHNYTIEWTPEGIKAYLDGEYYYTYDKTGDELEWPFAKPQNLIVNLAMGGGMGGAIDPSIESQQFVLDYVRVYELAE
ncbi:family 16 glycosylhydrolase [Roseivirga sp. E12]|uniref:glycoside hydrolase family 16 protein n=1 Tax=Roseivirga sp. E12 TaxID=2819237 RepID=UPI001ABBFFF3|nr:glycoside hydrolase family 16 protein [Roseivirga sp. E12]MBO3697502.1 glycoside hydrolase family 16 protein [Roseivirga sp. E12]